MNRAYSLYFPIWLLCYEATTYLSNDMYLPALPNIMQHLDLSVTEVQFTLTLWFLGSASMQLILGPVSNRFGRRPFLLLGGVIFMIANIMGATAETVTQLYIARFLQGATVCSVVVAGYAAIHELLGQDKAIRTLAWMSSIAILAPALGPLLGSVVLHLSNWRMTFYLLAFMALIALSASWWCMPESLHASQRQSIKPIAVMHSYQHILRNHKFINRLLIYCVLEWGMMAWLVIIPILSMEYFHYSAFEFGVIQALAFGGFTIGSQTIRFILPRIGINQLIKLGLVITLLGASAAILVALAMANSMMLFTIAVIVYMYGTGLVFSPINRLTIESSSQAMGNKVAVLSFGTNLFASFGSWVGSLHHGGLLWPAILITLSAGIASLVHWKSEAVK